ncbi:MAG: DUF4838 domain-containing protein [Clostridiales bacterium]|nr:DUF4838 domain-containing protein [Clostridiales bacterium]
MSNLKFISNGKSLLNFYIKDDASAIVNRAALDIIEAAFLATGVKSELFRVNDLAKVENGIIIAHFSDSDYAQTFKKEYDYTLGTDGFAVMEKDGNVIILGHNDFGASYGAHDFLEKNSDIIWARGAEEYSIEYLPMSEISATVINYCEKSPFKVRVWNTCGYGTDNVNHGDKGTAICLARNKITGVYHHCDEDWYEYGVTGQSLASASFRSIEEYIDTNPEYFMTYEDGTPRKLVATSNSHLESYLNFYHPEVPKIIAKKMAQYLEGCHENDVACYNMPDNPCFYMYHNGVKLHEQPFTTDCGVTVYPTDKNYKSTVYFNFINRLIKELNRIRPNTVIHTQAYMYSEVAPAIKVDDRVFIKVAPLSANMHVAHNDPVKKDNWRVRDNLKEWVKHSNSVCVNAYWNCFKGGYYSRPIWKVAQEDLKFWREIGIKGFTPEGKVDCSRLESYTEKQAFARRFNDFNEMYTWGLHKLMWNPDQDLEALKKRYCKIVYKEVAEEMLEYYNLIEKGYNGTDTYVWWMSGGDVYIYQFIIKAGIKDAVLATLEKALAKTNNINVKERIESIYTTLKEYIGKYEKFVDEDGEVLWCNGVDPLSEGQLDWMNNKDSIWNKGKKSVVLKNYLTLDDFDEKHKFSRVMLYDENNLYFGYTIFDEGLEKIVPHEECGLKVFREDGSELNFRAESYFGGNALNNEVFYGYTCGFNKGDTRDRYYINHGSPSTVKTPEGVKKVQKVFLSEDKTKRAAFFVQVIPYKALDVTLDSFKPYGHFCVFYDVYGRTGWGWKGFGLWGKQNFTTYKLVGRE